MPSAGAVGTWPSARCVVVGKVPVQGIHPSDPDDAAPFDFRMQNDQLSIRMSNTEGGRADLFRGTLDVMILQTLETLGPLHGYAVR